MSKLKVWVAVFPFGEIDAAWLKSTAERFIHPDSQRKSGKSQTRNAAHYAGRCALGALLQRVAPGGKVGRNDAWGYLELMDSSSIPLAGFRGNISHTDEIAVAVVGPHNVGVDVESVHRSAEKVINRVSSAEERRLADAKRIENSDPFFPGYIGLWSAKEAASKAVGLGMNFGLQRFEIRMVGSSPYSVKTDLKGPLMVSDSAVRFLRYDDYVISVCTERGDLVSEPELSKICPDSPGMLSKVGH